jgi:hypothetical protein
MTDILCKRPILNLVATIGAVLIVHTFALTGPDQVKNKSRVSVANF